MNDGNDSLYRLDVLITNFFSKSLYIMYKISIFYFVFSMFIGIMILYTLHPESETVYNYPLVDNVSEVIYKDEVGKCYSYEKEEKQC